MMERELQQAGENKEEEEAYKVKKKTHDLLPNADENMRKLKVRNQPICMYVCVLLFDCVFELCVFVCVLVQTGLFELFVCALLNETVCV